MSEFWKIINKCWNPETAAKKRAEGRVYIGDRVKVVKERKVPLGTVGVVTGIYENPYDLVSFDIARGAVALQCAGLDVQAIQYTNARVRIELDNGCVVYSYLNNLEIVKEKETCK